MPKILEHMRETILAAARRELLDHGYNALTMRGVAGECGIAVGTMYNYFPSKEVLTAEILLEDWQQALEDMRQGCRAAADMAGGLTAMYGCLERFYGRYRDMWAGYSFSDRARMAFGRRHDQLVEQLAGVVTGLLTRLGLEANGEIGTFFAENLLICVGGSRMTFGGFLHIAERLCEKPGIPE